MALSYLGMGTTSSLAVVVICSTLGGIGNGVEIFALMTAVQERTSDTFQARMSSLVESIHAGCPGLGFALGGAVATVFSPRATYFLAGVGATVVILTATLTLHKADLSTRATAPTSEPPSKPTVAPAMAAVTADC
jgi:MFS family permease